MNHWMSTPYYNNDGAHIQGQLTAANTSVVFGNGYETAPITQVTSHAEYAPGPTQYNEDLIIQQMMDEYIADNGLAVVLQAQPDVVHRSESFGLPESSAIHWERLQSEATRRCAQSPPEAGPSHWHCQEIKTVPYDRSTGVYPRNSSFGSIPNDQNNPYQDAYAAWNPTTAHPTLTVARSLGGITNIPPTRQQTTTTPRVARHRNTPGITISSLSTIIGNERSCQLKHANGADCTFRRPRGKKAAFALHVLNTHIGVELKLIRRRRLKRRDAQILFTEARVNRAEECAWCCPVEGCYIRMQRYVVNRHSKSHHKGYGVQAYQRGGGLKTGSSAILMDILEA